MTREKSAKFINFKLNILSVKNLKDLKTIKMIFYIIFSLVTYAYVRLVILNIRILKVRILFKYYMGAKNVVTN